ncbi:MAG: hypothetical protein ACQESR_06540 [Planctomycetota bacterium]
MAPLSARSVPSPPPCHEFSLYISGGWIFPGGKRPDASRPPVGRTRGGESHP